MNVTEDSITVIWAEPENPNGVIMGYILAISDGRRPVNISLDNLSYTFNDLNSSSEYQIDISAYVFSAEEDPFMVHNGMVETITVKTAVKCEFQHYCSVCIHGLIHCSHTYVRTYI